MTFRELVEVLANLTLRLGIGRQPPGNRAPVKFAKVYLDALWWKPEITLNVVLALVKMGAA